MDLGLAVQAHKPVALLHNNRHKCRRASIDKKQTRQQQQQQQQKGLQQQEQEESAVVVSMEARPGHHPSASLTTSSDLR